MACRGGAEMGIFGKVMSPRGPGGREARSSRDRGGKSMDERRGADQAYISTGVAGLDHILRGGFLREGFYLVQGDPGSGKTTLALQYLMACVRGGERGLYITLTETRSDLERACRSH